MSEQAPAGYTAARAWPAEGARVGIVTCERCGASLLLDPATPFAVMERHDRWHRAIANAERWDA